MSLPEYDIVLLESREGFREYGAISRESRKFRLRGDGEWCLGTIEVMDSVEGFGWSIVGLYVAPDFRRQGVASALLDFARADIGKPVSHSPYLTDDGRAFSQSVAKVAGLPEYDIVKVKDNGTDWKVYVALPRSEVMTTITVGGHKVLGYIAVRRYGFTMNKLPKWGIANIEVAPKHRRQGLATALLHFARQDIGVSVQHRGPFTDDGLAFSRAVAKWGTRTASLRMVEEEVEPYEKLPRHLPGQADWPRSAGKGSRLFVAYDGDDAVGALLVGKGGVIRTVHVRRDRRREGIATRLLEFARGFMRVRHSDDLTADGRAWSRAVAKWGMQATSSLRFEHPGYVVDAYDIFPGYWESGRAKLDPRAGQTLFVAYDGDVPVGGLKVDEGSGTIAMVYVDPFRRREGIATRLLEYARTIMEVHHSNRLSQDGKAWSKAVAKWGMSREAITDLNDPVLYRTDVYRGVRLQPSEQHWAEGLELLARGQTRAFADWLIDLMATGAGSDSWTGKANTISGRAGEWWSNSPSTAKDYAGFSRTSLDPPPSLPVVMSAIVDERDDGWKDSESSARGYGTFWRVPQGTPVTVSSFVALVPDAESARRLLETYKEWGQWGNSYAPVGQYEWWDADWQELTLPIPPMRTEAGMKRVASNGVYFHGSKKSFAPGTELLPKAQLEPHPEMWPDDPEDISTLVAKTHFVWMVPSPEWTAKWNYGGRWNIYIVRPNGWVMYEPGPGGPGDERYFTSSATVLDGPFSTAEEAEQAARDKYGWTGDSGPGGVDLVGAHSVWQTHGVPKMASRWGMKRTAITESWDAVRGGAAPDPGDGEGPITVNGGEPEFLWRIMSVAEWEGAQANGFIQGNDGGYTRAATYPAWRFHDGPTPGQRMVKMRYDASDGWKQATNMDGDIFAATHQPIPLDRVVGVSPPAVAKDFADNLGSGGHKWGLKRTASTQTLYRGLSAVARWGMQHAAVSGDGYLTLSTGEVVWGKYGAAGLLARHRGSDGEVRYFLQHRGAVMHGGTWGIPGGALDKGESPMEGALREFAEEVGVAPQGRVVDTYVAEVADGWSYTTVIFDVDEAFDHEADTWEGSEGGWFTAAEVASLNLHPGLAAAWPSLRSTARADRITVYRGMNFQWATFTDEGDLLVAFYEALAQGRSDEAARLVLNHVADDRPVGWHWSRDVEVAKRFAASSSEQRVSINPNSTTHIIPVVVEAYVSGAHIETDWDVLTDGAVNGYGWNSHREEAEVPLRSGAPVEITAVHLAVPDDAAWAAAALTDPEYNQALTLSFQWQRVPMSLASVASKTATMPYGWRGADPEAQWTKPTIVVWGVWPGFIGGGTVIGKSQEIDYRDRSQFGVFVGQAERAAYDWLEDNPAEAKQMTGFILRARGSMDHVDFGYSGKDWQRGFVWQDPTSAPSLYSQKQSREMWWAMQYDDGDKFAEVLSIDAVGVYPHDLAEPVLEPITLEVYRGISLYAEDDPLRVEKDGGGTGSSWTTSIDVAMAIAERGMAGFQTHNVPGDIYESWQRGPANLGNGRWDEVKDYDKEQWTPVVLRAEVTITPGPGQTDPAFYYPFGAGYASEQEVDIPRGSEVRITGYQRASRKPYGNGDYIQWQWPSSWTSANVVRTAERWGMKRMASTQTLYRGLALGYALDNAELEKHLANPDALVREALNTSRIGIHWTDDYTSAYNFATGRDPEGYVPELSWDDDDAGWRCGVILEAEVDSSSVLEPGSEEHDDYAFTDAILDYGIEREVTVRGGAAVRVSKAEVIFYHSETYEEVSRTVSLGMSATASGDDDYRLSHQPPEPDDETLDLSRLDEAMGDVYDHPEWYGGDRATGTLLRSVRGNPDARVTVYRAVPPGVLTIEHGNWVTLSRSYAEDHGADQSVYADGQWQTMDWPVLSAEVRAGDVYFGGNDVMEYGYWGPTVRAQGGIAVEASRWGMKHEAMPASDGWWYHSGDDDPSRYPDGKFIHLGTMAAAKARMFGSHADRGVYRVRVSGHSPNTVNNPVDDYDANRIDQWYAIGAPRDESGLPFIPVAERGGANDQYNLEHAFSQTGFDPDRHDTLYYLNNVEDPGSVSVMVLPSAMAQVEFVQQQLSLFDDSPFVEASLKRTEARSHTDWAADVAHWESTRPWGMSREDVEAQRVPGFFLMRGRSSGHMASYHLDGRIGLTDDFFEQAPGLRRVILYHEAGHALESEAGYEAMATAFGVESALDIIDLPGTTGLGYNPDEIAAEAYATLWANGGKEWFAQWDTSGKLLPGIITLARTHGFPIPPGMSFTAARLPNYTMKLLHSGKPFRTYAAIPTGPAEETMTLLGEQAIGYIRVSAEVLERKKGGPLKGLPLKYDMANWGIDFIEVVPAYRRMGLGAAMLNYARQDLELPVNHRPPFTDDGLAFSQSVAKWGMRSEAGSSWRPYASSPFWDEYPVVVHTDGGPSGRKSYDIYIDGQIVASRPSLTEAKNYVEDRIGPQDWQTKRLDKVTIDHYWWGLTDEFSSPTTVYVIPDPTGGIERLR